MAGPSGELYRPFADLTRAALRHAAARLGLKLTPAHEAALMDAYASLPAFPDAAPALAALRAKAGAARVPLFVLSNGDPAALEAALGAAGLRPLFDGVLSVQPLRVYKPDPRVYAMGVRAISEHHLQQQRQQQQGQQQHEQQHEQQQVGGGGGSGGGGEAGGGGGGEALLAPHDVLFVSSNGWDAAGAAWAGLRAFWLNRARLPPEELGAAAAPAHEGRCLDDVLALF